MALFRFLIRLAFILLLVPGAALASVTNGTIKGTTVDELGLPIPGVVISLDSEALMGGKKMQTDAEGRFLFIELPPGTYTVTAKADGFASVQRQNVPVNVGRTQIITMEMPADAVGQEMVIEDRNPVIDTESANRGSVLTREFLDRIPAGRSYQSAVQLTAGVSGGANPNVGGASSNENTYMLDGVNITDPVTGTFALNFNFDSIEQVEVITDAFDPEYGINLGGVINIVTQTGSNNFKFRSGIYHRNGSWSPKQDWRYASDGTTLAPSDFGSRFESYIVGGQISGPIVKDKAWFIASYQMSRTLIANAGVPVPRDFDGHYVFGKLTFQPSADHRFTVLAQTNPTTIDNTYFGGRFIKPEAQGRQAQGGYVTSLQWDWFISPTVFLETKSLLQKEYLESYAVACTHDKDLGYHPCEEDELENNIDFFTPGRIGQFNAYDSENEIRYDFDDRWRGSLQSKFSILQVDFLGTHDFKAGMESEVLVWNRTFGVNGNLIFYDLNESPYNPDTLKNYYWVEYSGPFSFVSTASTTGLFIQDVWKPVDNLTFRYGTRYDRQVFRNDLGQPIMNTGLWGPRFSTIWDPWADGKTKLKASVGRFNAQSRLGVSSFMNQSGLGSKLYLGEFFEGYTSYARDSYSYAPIENFNSLLDGLTAPRADEFQVGAEREIIRDVALQLYFTGRYTRNLYASDELNYMYDEDAYQFLGTTDGTQNRYPRLRTPSVARRTYYRTDFSVKKIESNRWQGTANYSYVRSYGSVQGTPASFLQVAPLAQYYENANLGTDIRHDAFLTAAWDIPNDPWTTQIGTIFNLESGYPITRTYRSAVEFANQLRSTVGTYARTETVWDLSFLVRQKFPVKKGTFNAVFQVDNITNRRTGEFSGLTTDNRWVIGTRQDPLEFQVGAEYEF